jgi:hypothetical protein
MTLELDKTYLLRNGQRVYAAMLHSHNADIVIGYGDDGIYHHFNRKGGTSRMCFGYNGGPVGNDRRIDIVGEAMGFDDLRDEHFASQDHAKRQRAALEVLRDQPDFSEKWEAWNRANRPPGPLGAGLKESDYD